MFLNPNEQVGAMRQRIAQDAIVIARLHETVDALRRRLLETRPELNKAPAGA